MGKEVNRFDIVEYMTAHGNKLGMVTLRYHRNYYYILFHDKTGVRISSLNFDIVTDIYCQACNLVFKRKLKCPTCGSPDLISLEELERRQAND